MLTWGPRQSGLRGLGGFVVTRCDVHCRWVVTTSVEEVRGSKQVVSTPHSFLSSRRKCMHYFIRYTIKNIECNMDKFKDNLVI